MSVQHARMTAPWRGPQSAVPVLAIAPVAGSSGGTIVLPTHPLHAAMRRGLLTGTEHAQLRWDLGGRRGTVRVQGTAVRAGAPLAAANLLRTHLDLLNQAHRVADPAAGFGYDLGRALDRMGYQRLASGAFHPATHRALQTRLDELGRFCLETHGGGGPELRAEPFWQLRAPTGSERTWWAVPGRWYAALSLETRRHQVADDLLALSLDGHGNQVQRIALLLASELAAWEREEMRKGGLARSIGTLLERSRVATREGLVADAARRLNTPKRLREYLVGEGFADEGAFAMLRSLGFGIDIRDEEEFWASGRGWVERFWESRLRLEAWQQEQPLAS